MCIRDSSTSLTMTLSTSTGVQDTGLFQLTQSAAVHLQLPLQLCDCLRRFLVALLKCCFNTVRLLTVSIGVIHRRQTQVLINVLCTKLYQIIAWCHSYVHNTLRTIQHAVLPISAVSDSTGSHPILTGT